MRCTILDRIEGGDSTGEHIDLPRGNLSEGQGSSGPVWAADFCAFLIKLARGTLTHTSSKQHRRAAYISPQCHHDLYLSTEHFPHSHHRQMPPSQRLTRSATARLIAGDNDNTAHPSALWATATPALRKRKALAEPSSVQRAMFSESLS